MHKFRDLRFWHAAVFLNAVKKRKTESKHRVVQKKSTFYQSQRETNAI